MPYVPYRWAVIRLSFSGPFLRVRINDSLGRRASARAEWSAGLSLGLPSGASLAKVIWQSLLNLTEGLPPTRSGPHSTGPVPVAIFLSMPLQLEGWAQEEITKLVGARSDEFQIVQLSKGRSLRREPFRLPFRILTSLELAPTLDALKNESWYAGEAAVSKFGLQISSAEVAERSIGDTTWDVVLTRRPQEVFHVARHLTVEQRPRLVVGVFAETGDLSSLRGIAYLSCTGNPVDVSHFVQELMFGFIHDLPVHEAVKAAQRKFQVIATLVADPISNQYLRIFDSLAEVKRQSDRWRTSLPNLSFKSLLERLPSENPDVARLSNFVSTYTVTPQHRKLQEDLRNWDDSVRSLPSEFANFEQEGLGLVPLSSIEQEASRLHDQEQFARKTGAEITADLSFAKILRENQQRVVDITLQRLQTDPVLQSVPRTSTLAANTDYEIRLHIGQRLSESIMAGTPPPIDPLLPDPEDAKGYVLEVLIQGKQFTVCSKPTKALRLPIFGGSEPVYFRVRTPGKNGPAQLRVCVYHHNHLLQSFLLFAEITATEELRGSGALKVVLEFSRTNSFGNIREFQPRSLSIGVNDGAHTHEVVIKGENASQEFTFFPVTYEPEVERFRSELDNAVRDPATPQQARVYPPVAPGHDPSNQVADYIRSWARIGRSLYEALLNKASSSAMRKALFNLAQTSNKKIQTVRFDENFVFPWMLLYDYLLPEEISGAAPPPVCLGWDKSGAFCSHTYKDQVFCVNGFWGIRHYVEELIRRTCETATTVPRQGQYSVRFVGDPQLNETAQLATDLTMAVGVGQFAQGPNEQAQLLDLLWQDPPQRPAILIILAHLETQEIAGQPKQSRLVLDQNQWLTQESITNKRSLFPDIWSQPRPIVFLGACQSAATSVKTINDFVNAWNGCGAAAVIGTEAVVGSDLAAKFACEVAKRLWNGKPLGEAVTQFRRNLIGSGNVLAFLFQAFGDVDLLVQ